MPRKAHIPSVAEDAPAPNGTAAVDRALSLVDAFSVGDGALSLQQLAERTRLHKSTVLRLLASLQHSQWILRTDDGRYRLGPTVARVHAVYAASFSLEHVVMPELQALVTATGESAAYHVRQGDARLCLYRVDSPNPVRDHTRAGDLLPLDRGSGGRVLMAFSGAVGKVYDDVRRQGVIVLKGDRVPQLAGISAPCFDARGQLAGALTLTMPAERLRPEQAPLVEQAAKAVSRGLGYVSAR